MFPIEFAFRRISAMGNKKIVVAVLLGLFCLTATVGAMSQTDSGSRQPIGPGKIVAHTALGGFILGYDIDQTGTEGILSEALTLNDGHANVAVETFDQKTGKLI